MRHGQAISIGMVWMAEVSRRLVGLDDGMAALHHELLDALGLPIRYDPGAWRDLRTLMSLDKKARGSKLRLVGLATQGRPTIIEDPDDDLLEAAYTAAVAR